MASKIVHILPSGRMVVHDKTPEEEKKTQEFATLLPTVVYFFA